MMMYSYINLESTQTNYHKHALTVRCRDGDVELVSTNVKRAGVIRFCVDGLWGTVCGGEQNPFFASVACRQLGYSQYGKHLNCYFTYFSLQYDWCRYLIYRHLYLERHLQVYYNNFSHNV